MAYDSSWLSTVHVDRPTVEDITAGRAANRKETQTRQLNSIFAKHLDRTGNLNETGFYEDAAAAGLAPEHIQTAMDWYSKKKAAQVQTQRDNRTLRTYGADPEAAGRNQATIGAPQPVLESQQAPAAPSAGPDKLQAWFDRLKGRANPLQAKPAAQEAPTPEVSAQTRALNVAAPPAPTKTDALATAIGMPSAPAQTPDQPGSEVTISNGPNVHTFYEDPNSFMRADEEIPRVVTPPDNRSAEQKVEDSYQQENSPLSRGSVRGGGQAAPVQGLTFAGMNPMERDTAVRSLARKGYDVSNPEAALKAYQDRFLGSVPEPVPANPQIAMTPHGMDEAKLAEEQNRADADMARYSAARADALAKASSELFKNYAEVQGERRASEDQEYSLAGQKTDLFVRPVSAEEAGKVKMYRAAVDDIVQAPNTFAGAFQAAVAKAKTDGSVNADAIQANLAAMGSPMPSEEFVQLRMVMDNSSNPLSDGWKYFKSKIATKGPVKGPDPEWRKQAIANINAQIQYNGGKPYSFSNPGTGAAVTKTVADDMKPATKTEALADSLGMRRERPSKPAPKKQTKTDPRASSKGR